MTNNEGSKARAKAKQYESILVVGVVRIVDKQRGVVQENGLRLLERDAVLPSVGTVLLLGVSELRFEWDVTVYLHCRGEQVASTSSAVDETCESERQSTRRSSTRLERK